MRRAVVVQNAAIAHHEAAPGQCDDFAERRYTILQRHRQSSVRGEAGLRLRLDALVDRDVVEEQELAPFARAACCA